MSRSDFTTVRTKTCGEVVILHEFGWDSTLVIGYDDARGVRCSIVVPGALITIVHAARFTRAIRAIAEEIRPNQPSTTDMLKMCDACGSRRDLYIAGVLQPFCLRCWDPSHRV